MTLFWIVVIIVIIGFGIWKCSSKCGSGKGPDEPKMPTPPSSPPPPPPAPPQGPPVGM